MILIINHVIYQKAKNKLKKKLKLIEDETYPDKKNWIGEDES